MNQAGNVYVTGSFPGGNPQNPQAITRVGKSAFLIIPFSEDNDPCYKFRLDVKIINICATPTEINITIDWQDEQYAIYRDIIYYGNNNGWRCSVTGTEAGKNMLTLNVPPGETYLTLNPKYDYNDLLNKIARIGKHNNLKISSIFTTKLDKEIFIITCSNDTGPIKKNIVISARTHPYETASSYCMEGIIEYLENSNSKNILDKYNIHLIPMICPDGVEQGCCKLSEIGGVDLAREVITSHDLTKAYIKFLARLQPVTFLALHNWMLKDVDGLYHLNWFQSKKIIKALKKNCQPGLLKQWKIALSRGIMTKKSDGLLRYCRDNFGTKVFALEFPWHKRSSQDIRNIGHSIVPSILKLI